MSLYIQLTTHCNMSCAHCIFRCSSEKRGDFMHPKTFAKAVKLAENFGTGILLGGGEPTLHPKFWEFFGKAMAADTEWVHLITNGSKTEMTLALNAMSVEGGKFGCELSLDEYHDPIDESVVEAFKSRGRGAIRDTSNNISRTGSAEDNGIGVKDECDCTDLFVVPNGDMRLCGCLDGYHIGHIDTIDEDKLDRANRVVQSLQCSRPHLMPQAYIDYIEHGTESEELEELY